MANLELVTKLAEWGTSDEFTGELDQWMDLRCTIFDRDGNEDGSQPLDWGAAFQEYNTWLDGQLEKFCASVGAGHEEVSMAVAETLENGRETEFFPEFMRCTEYDEFAAQMRQRAVKTKTLTAQKGAGANVGTIKPYDISGIWAADKSKMDPDGVDKTLAYMGCPFFARKILKHASKFVQDIVIVVDGNKPGDTVTLVYTLQLFGTSIDKLTVGEFVPVKNLWGKWIETKACPDDECFRTEARKHPVHEGTTSKGRWFFLDGDTNRLVWETTFKRPDQPEHVYSQYFLRQGGGEKSGAVRRASMIN